MTRGILFDMDGVLADTETFYAKRRADFMQAQGYEPVKTDLTGSNEKAIWEAFVPHDEALRETLKQQYYVYQESHPVPYETLIDPAVAPLFTELKQRGLSIAIASSSYLEDIEALMETAGITGLVDFHISGQQCAAHKPAPEIYLRALDALGLSTEEAFAVEDSPTGILAAKNAGLTVYALRPKNGTRLDQSAANGILDTLPEVLDKLH